MDGYNPDYHGTYADHKPTCCLRVHGGEGKSCDCGYLNASTELVPIPSEPISMEAPF